MPVWWGVFAYMIIVSSFGMIIYKNKKATQTLSQKQEIGTFDEKSIGVFFALLSFIPLVFFAGQRSFMFDSEEYQHMFNTIYSGDLNEIGDIISEGKKGPLFDIIIILYKHFINLDYNGWFTLLAIIQGVSMALMLQRYSVNFAFSVYMFFTLGGTLWFVNGIRQLLAVSVVILFSNFVFERKTIPFLIVVLIAFFIHSSALLWVPVYFLIKLKPWSKQFILLSVLLAIALFAFSKSSLISDTEYSYLTGVDYNVGVKPIRVAVMFVPAVIAFVKRKEIEKKGSKLIDYLICLSIISAEFYFIGMLTSGTIGRVPYYFQVYTYVFLPWLLKNVFEEDMSKTIKLVAIVLYMLFFIYDMYGIKNGIYHSTTLSLDYFLY